jgi:hypothetical protein
VRIVASCWAIGRNSAEATKARLMRAVRAALAALPALLAGFLAWAPAFRPSDEDLSPWTTAFVVFFVFVVLDEAAPAGFDVEPVEDCPGKSGATKRKASAHASRGIEVGEEISLMLSL